VCQGGIRFSRSDDVEQVAKEFKEKSAQILRENRDASGKLIMIFVKDPMLWKWKSGRLGRRGIRT
ncbi:MAG TPA: hypothetical protein VIE89_34460, partial [Candidatus Binatia bacterium]